MIDRAVLATARNGVCVLPDLHRSDAVPIDAGMSEVRFQKRPSDKPVCGNGAWCEPAMLGQEPQVIFYPRVPRTGWKLRFYTSRAHRRKRRIAKLEPSMQARAVTLDA
jgi:hypothetical protein